MAKDDRPPTLEYAAPPVFYAGEYRTRSPYTLLNAISAGGVGLAALIVATLVLPDPAGRRIVQGFACVLLLFAAWNGWHWHRDATCAVRLTGDGIEIGRRFWPWTRVAAVGGVREAGGVTLTFDVRGAIEERANHSLAALPAMRVSEYKALRAALDDHFRATGLDVETTEPRHRRTSL